MPPTLLTLPAEIREQIWNHCLVSPTHRVLPVHYPASPDSIPSSLTIWTGTRRKRRDTNATSHYDIFSKVLQFVPCASTSAALLSPSLLPLAQSLPLVSRQLYAETSARLWSGNTIVFPDYGATREVLTYLGEARLDVQQVEMIIGNVWDLLAMEISRMMETLDELWQLVGEGSLRKLRLVYVDGGACHRTAFQMWRGALLTSNRDKDWGQCEREIVWEDKKMKTDRLREVLARQWGLEGGIRGWDDTVTWEDWEPVEW
ncbi:hypothetical protein VF21_03010 [Pseudogymnoascus sp. 05NY08]|nr:hypothetical protein VF21_03010 [Pseudogymnoascus sp. 05NY08]